MRIIVILIIAAVLISLIFSYCGAYYRAIYLAQAKEDSDNGDPSDHSKEKEKADNAEKTEIKDGEDNKTEEEEIKTESNKDHKIKTEKSESDEVKSDKTKNDGSKTEKIEKGDIIAENYTSEKRVAFFKISENLKILKVSIIVLFSVFSLIGIAIILCLYEKTTAVEAIQHLVYLDCLFLIATIDFKVKRIPNKLILFLFVFRIITIICKIVFDGEPWYAILTTSAIGMAVALITVFVCLLVSRGGIGAGDLKMFGIIGFYFGLQGLMEIMIYSLFLASIIGIILLIARKAKLKSSLAMAPFMFIGSMLHILML